MFVISLPSHITHVNKQTKAKQKNMLQMNLLKHNRPCSGLKSKDVTSNMSLKHFLNTWSEMSGHAC